jgi:hypothetical protein
VIRDCRCDGGSVGIGAGQYSEIMHCLVEGSTAAGISVDKACVISDCLVFATSSSPGITTGGNSTIQNCYAEAGLDAIHADTVMNCVGVSATQIGVDANNATNCTGRSTSGPFGLRSANNAMNCYGATTSSTGYGLYATNALNCSGDNFATTGEAVGLSALTTANNCTASSKAPNSGIALRAFIAIGCTGTTPSGGTLISAVHRYLSGIGPDS